MEAIADPKDLVRRSYDQISYAYRGDSLPRDRNYFRWLAEIGFSVQWARFIPEGDGEHTLLLAQRPRLGPR